MTTNRDTPITYYWCQTVELIILTVVVRTSKIDKVKVQFQESFLDVRLKSGPKTTYRLQLGLANPIVPNKCSYSILSAKLELKLKKLKPLRWSSLGGEIKQSPIHN